MAHNHPHHGPDEREFGTNWVTSSKYLFYLQVFTLLAFVFGCSYNLYKATRYEAKPRVEIQESSQYTPKYKS
jgi:hypothetical protein